MKTMLQSKTAFIVVLISAGISIGILSCKKDSSAGGSSTITEADAAELTTNAIVPASGGMVLQLNSSVSVYKTVVLSCGVQKDTTVTRSSVSGAYPSYSYSLKWSYLLNCAGVVPSQLNYSFTGSSSYDAVRMSSSDNSSGSMVLTGLEPGTSAYTLNTNYTRNGSQTSKVRNNNSFSSKLSIQSSNIVMDKTSMQIVSGTASVAVSGSSTAGNSFSYGGTITFLGGNKATLVLNSGTSYSISW